MIQLKASVQDKSWRVRYNLAVHIIELADNLGKEIVKTELLAAMLRLLRDPYVI